jgi:TorA maturation chaperone TorD
MADGKAAEEPTGKTSIARAVIYRVLAWCFSYPDRQLIELFYSARLEEFLQSWRYLGLDATDNMARLGGWLEEYPDRDAALQELEREYTRLFVNAYPGVVTPPYSSVYLGKDRLVWGSSASEAVQLYRAAGLGIAQDFHDIPDHIAAELEFASYLVAEQQKAGEDSSARSSELVSIEKRFLEGHLFKWAPVFFSRVIEESRASFYR